MTLFKDSDFAKYGLITRASKGAELTHQELDMNISIGLDIRMFDNIAEYGIVEYPSMIVAPTAPDAGNSITLSPVEGFCAVSLQGALLVGTNVQIVGNHNGCWLYRADYASIQNVIGDPTGNYSIGIEDGDEFLVISSTTDIVLNFEANAGATIVNDVPPLKVPKGGFGGEEGGGES